MKALIITSVSSCQRRPKHYHNVTSQDWHFNKSFKRNFLWINTNSHAHSNFVQTAFSDYHRLGRFLSLPTHPSRLLEQAGCPYRHPTNTAKIIAYCHTQVNLNQCIVVSSQSLVAEVCYQQQTLQQII